EERARREAPRVHEVARLHEALRLEELAPLAELARAGAEEARHPVLAAREEDAVRELDRDVVHAALDGRVRREEGDREGPLLGELLRLRVVELERRERLELREEGRRVTAGDDDPAVREERGRVGLARVDEGAHAREGVGLRVEDVRIVEDL